MCGEPCPKTPSLHALLSRRGRGTAFPRFVAMHLVSIPGNPYAVICEPLLVFMNFPRDNASKELLQLISRVALRDAAKRAVQGYLSQDKVCDSSKV